MKRWIALVLAMLMIGTALADDGWYCAACDRTVTSNFCSGCGASRPVENQCAACGHVGESGRAYRFCPRCGAAMTAAPAPTAAPEELPDGDDLILTLAGEGKAYPLGSMKMMLTTYPDGSRDATPISLSAGANWSVKVLLFVTGNAVEGVMDVQLALFGADEQPLWQQEIPAVDFSASFGQKLLGEFSLAGVLTQPGDYMMAAYIGGKLGTTTLLTVSP
ncbi:MAG: hypothetical protein IKK21_01275 [Clostridia bacterium]|nr:hypothetical protein [Clostridia bacterium]